MARFFIRSRCALAATLAITLLCSPGIARAAAAPVKSLTPVPDQAIPFALAVSGGVSLGSYEAGVNWAVIRYFKLRRDRQKKPGDAYPRLAAVAGASAGAINAFASAVSWCLDEDNASARGDLHDSINDNLFRDIWLHIGFDDLLPEDASSPGWYQDDDGLISRSAFSRAIGKIEAVLRAPIFRHDCSVPIGLLVTRVDPITMSVAGVQVQNQRFMIPLELHASDPGRGAGSVHIRSFRVNPDDPLLGNVMYLQGTRDTDHAVHVISPEAAIEAILASSAFPVAFGRRLLDHCVKQSSGPAKHDDPLCPLGYIPARAEFLDGGLFDNIPLGTAKALAEPREADARTRDIWERSSRRFNYVYLDPDTRRSLGTDRAATLAHTNGEARGEQPPTSMTFGLRSQLRFLGGAIKTGRNYELYNALRGGEWTNQTRRYLEELIAAVDRKYPEAAGSADRSRWQPSPSKCAAVFSQPLRTGGQVGRSNLQAARSCILYQGQALESLYNGIPVENAPLPLTTNITPLRNTLIRWMIAVASALDEKQLALSIAELTQDKLGDRRILLPTRFSPITGSMVGNFGAFIDQPFREYDYYAGVYDAVHGIADFYCEWASDYDRCLSEQVRRIHHDLGVGSVQDANTVFLLLARLEHSDHGAPESPWSWVAPVDTSRTDGNMAVIFRSLTSDPPATGSRLYEAPPLNVFIRRLSENGYDTSASSSFVNRIFQLKEKDERTWYYPLTSRASNRLLALEEQERKSMPGGAVISGAIAVGALGVHSFVRNEERFSINQSTAPDGTWQSYLPYEIATDVRNGGLDISWEPALRFRTLRASINFKITPIEFNRYGEKGIWFTHADMFLSYRQDGIVSSFGIGPTFSGTWKEWPEYDRYNVGASLYLGLFQDKYRITAGVMSFKNDGFAGDVLYINLGITDFPGIVYWLSKAF